MSRKEPSHGDEDDVGSGDARNNAAAVGRRAGPFPAGNGDPGAGDGARGEDRESMRHRFGVRRTGETLGWRSHPRSGITVARPRGVDHRGMDSTHAVRPNGRPLDGTREPESMELSAEELSIWWLHSSSRYGAVMEVSR